jgi:heme/copper-type cytochrome/quinol oxidase subunit 1
VSFAIVLPTLALLGLWADTIRRGRPRLASPLLYALGAGAMLLVGVAAGAASTIKELALYDTTWRTSTAHYVMLATTLALLGGVTYWAPRLFGRKLAEGPSRTVAALLLFGTIGLSFPDLVTGALDQAWFFGGLPVNDVSTIEALNLVSAAGGALVLLAALLFIGTVARAIPKGDPPGDDPWTGHTLEWATTLPEISSEAPLYDARHLAGAEATD